MKSLVDNEEWKELSKGYWFSNHGRFASQWTKGKNSHIDHNKREIKITKPKPDNRKGYRGDYIENAINTFAAFVARDQIYMDSDSTIDERVKSFNQNAVFATAFMGATALRTLRGGAAYGGAAIFTTGFGLSEGDDVDKLINGSVLTLLWAIGQGYDYVQAKKLLNTFFKTEKFQIGGNPNVGATVDQFLKVNKIISKGKGKGKGKVINSSKDFVNALADVLCSHNLFIQILSSKVTGTPSVVIILQQMSVSFSL